MENLQEIDYKVPRELKATLRDYQLTGFKWFKTLSHYEFGGILADEMGLGKTIQTIAFLLSEKNKKSIIVTPTSLIYNWISEFDLHLLYRNQRLYPCINCNHFLMFHK